MKYFMRYWGENRGDEYSHWGHSRWYFEVDDGGRVVRQIESYDDGPTLAYDRSRSVDEHGFLASAFDPQDMAGFAIEREEFDERWEEAEKHLK